jgi:NAD+ synthase (glutamine-hydrolysing)
MIIPYHIIRVASCTPVIQLGNPQKNAEMLLSQVQCYTRTHDLDILVFPELFLTGYHCGDLFHQAGLHTQVERSLEYIQQETQSLETVLIFGLPVNWKEHVYNAAVVMQRGMILGVVPKTFLPTYNEFYEKRWFTPGDACLDRDIQLLGESIPFGASIIFTGSSTPLKIGVELCEDVWAPIPMSSYAALAGATVIVNVSASNWLVSKRAYRRELVKNQSARCISAYIYCSSGIGESTTDTVYDGHQIIACNGQLLAESEPHLRRESSFTQAEIDLEPLIYDRMHRNTFSENVVAEGFREIGFQPLKSKRIQLNQIPTPTPFIPSDAGYRTERCQEILHIQSSALAQRFHHIQADKLVVGISGGLDSTLALLVIVQALAVLDLPLSHALALTMPGFGTTKQTLTNARTLCHNLGVALEEIGIEELSTQHLKQLDHPPEKHDVTYENVQARIRTLVLMNKANQTNGMVVGTGDLSELALGWATYNGDHMSMYGVNASIPKTLVRYIVQAASTLPLFAKAREILAEVVDTPITPELLPAEEGEISQETEAILGPYEVHDFFLFYFLRYGFSPKKIQWLCHQTFKETYTTDQLDTWLNRFIKRFFTQQFKRSCLPDGPKIGSVSLSPRADWRMPSDADFESWLV